MGIYWSRARQRVEIVSTFIPKQNNFTDTYKTFGFFVGAQLFSFILVQYFFSVGSKLDIGFVVNVTFYDLMETKQTTKCEF